MAITIKTPQELDTLREGGKRLAAILKEVVSAAKPGVSTLDLDVLAERLIIEQGGRPSFKGYTIPDAPVPYPASICASVNEEVVHAIPRKGRVLNNGDIVGIDIGMWWPDNADPKRSKKERSKGSRELCTDMAVTIGIGEISEDAQQLIATTREALRAGIEAVKPGIRFGDISYAIQSVLDKQGFGIVRGLAGHGLGYELHEEPLIPNYGHPATGPEVKEGMVIAIEPMATLGSDDVDIEDDGWTFTTKDKSLAAHFEHSLIVTADGSEIITQ